MSNITINDLSSDQRQAYDSIVGWMRDYDRQPVLTLGGYAGSGKSTLVSLVAEQTDLPAFCAYTGKATSVLRRKLRAAGTVTVGVQRRDALSSDSPYCGTIHSLIYRLCECREPVTNVVQKPCPTCDEELVVTDGAVACSNGHVLALSSFNELEQKMKFVYPQKDAEGHCKHCDDRGWLRREALDRNYGLIIVDEASMVDDTMLHDLREYDVPILAVGDHGQLPPIGGVGSLMRSPNLRLEKIHRQAEGNPIIALSKMVREQGRLSEDFSGDAVTFRSLRTVEQIVEERYRGASPERLLEMGFACYTNRRRGGINAAVRRALGTARQMPRSGEHVICLRNMKAEGKRPPVANGMRGVLASDATPQKGREETHISALVGFPEDEIEAASYMMLSAQFGREKTFQSPEELMRETGIRSFNNAGSLFDFGYAMTVHKMQGSQFDDLVVCVERPGPVSDEDWRRWLYTAVTRAAKKLTVLR